MDLETFWFCLIVVVWAMYFLLEGFDFGVGMLLPFVPRSDEERTTALRTIGPVWDGNEVWLVVDVVLMRRYARVDPPEVGGEGDEFALPAVTY